MKTLTLLIPTLVTAAALAAGTDSLTGKWQVHTSIASNESDSTCTFTQAEAALTGTCTSDQGDVKIMGKVDGKKISWSFKTEYNGSPLTVQYEGTLSGEDKIAGTTTVPEFSVDGEFTATRAK